MKPEEAIEVLSNELIVITDMIGYCKDFEKESDLALAYRVKRQEAHNVAISALKEIQQYREIGTVEECREAVKNYKSIVCSSAEKDSDGKCLGYGKSDIDDEPCKICKNCKESTGYLERMENE